jgi:5-methylcytosine-specific restriction endonuclease McrA
MLLDWTPELRASHGSYLTAIAAASTGSHAQALQALRQLHALRADDWYNHIEAARRQRVEHYESLGVAKPHTIPREDQDTPTQDDLKHKLFQRDGYVCRYCGIRVLDPRVAAQMQLLFGEADMQFAQNKGLKIEHVGNLWVASDDHIVARQVGGRSALSNLVTACLPCNGAKGSYLLQNLGLDFPAPATDAWDGGLAWLPGLRAAVADRKNMLRKTA